VQTHLFEVHTSLVGWVLLLLELINSLKDKAVII
jgi:hypothetical protein